MVKSFGGIWRVGTVVAGLMAAPLAAQSVRGTVQDAAKQPVAGVVLSLLDSTNAVVARALSDERGEFRMLAPRAGTLQLRAQRIGFQATLSSPFVVMGGATVTPVVTLEGVKTQLAAVRVVASSSCGRADASDAALYAVWEQAQTSLAASLLTSGTRGLTTSIMNVQRVLDPRGKLLEQALTMRSGNVIAPWSALPIDSLRRRGYVWVDADNALTYNAPGIDGFVSPRFLEDHCFKLVASKDTSEIGVNFEPTLARLNRSEIRGTMWVARASAELRRAEFTYTAVPGVPASPVPGGGSMRFATLANGAVIIDTWELRMPVTSREQFGGTRTRVDQIQTTGGLVVAIRRGADTLFRRPTVALTGIVRDSVSGRPLAGASVRLSGTQNATRSAANGTFELRDVLPGQYTLAVATPALDSMRAAVGTDVVVRDSLAPLIIKVPTEAQVAQSLCGASFSLNKGVGAVLGAVTRAGTSEGVAGIPVVADWKELSTGSLQSLTQGQSKRLQTKTDASGGYRLCGVPADAALTVRAFPNSGRAQPHTVRLTASERFATLPLTVDANAPAVASFRGVVIADSTNRPVPDAEVSVVGTELRTRSNAQGEFAFDDVPAGTREVSVRKVGFARMTASVTFTANDEEERRVVLSPLTVLDSVAIVAERNPLRLMEFEENRKVGLGWFLGRTELEKFDGQMLRQAMANAREINVIGGRYPVSTQYAIPIRAIGSATNPCPPPMTYSPPLPERSGRTTCACFPLVIQDGVVRNGTRPTEAFDLQTVPVSQLEAIEWYSSPAKLPAQFNMLDANCGVLVLHTRRPGDTKKPGDHF